MTLHGLALLCSDVHYAVLAQLLVHLGVVIRMPMEHSKRPRPRPPRVHTHAYTHARTHTHARTRAHMRAHSFPNMLYSPRLHHRQANKQLTLLDPRGAPPTDLRCRSRPSPSSRAHLRLGLRRGDRAVRIQPSRRLRRRHRPARPQRWPMDAARIHAGAWVAVLRPSPSVCICSRSQPQSVRRGWRGRRPPHRDWWPISRGPLATHVSARASERYAVRWQVLLVCAFATIELAGSLASAFYYPTAPVDKCRAVHPALRSAHC